MARWPVIEKWRSSLERLRLKRATRSSGSSLIWMAEKEAPSSYGLQRGITALTEQGENVVDPGDGYNELEQFKYASMLLCDFPDDALDVAESYITEKADHLGDHAIYEGQHLATDVGTRQLDLGVWTLGLDVRAMNTPDFNEVQGLTEALRTELDKRTQAAKEAAESAGEAIGRSRTYIKRRIKTVKGVRYLALFCFALVSWGVSEVADRLSLPSLPIALASFVVLERVVGDRILEPLLLDYRRAALATVVSRAYENAPRSGLAPVVGATRSQSHHPWRCPGH